MTTKEDIRAWLNEGKQRNATHVVVVVDTFDYEDYPVYVQPESNVREIYDRYDGKNMQRVMEVYNLSMDFDEQLNKPRSFNF